MRLRATVPALLAAITAAPAITALPTAAAAPVVSDVTVQWTDASRSFVRVSWTSSTPAPATITLVTPDRSTDLGATGAGTTSILIDPTTMSKSSDPADRSTFKVTPDGGTGSSSVVFDRYVPESATPQVAFGPGDTITTTGGAVAGTDGTPNDPLDVTDPLRWAPSVYTQGNPSTGYCGGRAFGIQSSPVFTTTVTSTPLLLLVRPFNEWGYGEFGLHGYDGYGQMSLATLKTSAPTSAAYGSQWVLTGELIQRHLYFTPWNGDCGLEFESSTGRTVVLQARKNASSPWVAVTTARTSNDKFRFSIAHPGSRQYRVVAPNRVTGAIADHGTATNERTVAGITRVLSARMLTPSVSYGRPATAYVAVSPAGSQRATLQYRTSSGAWTNVLTRTLAAGRVSTSFTWLRRGTTTFRWYVAASTAPSGYPVQAVSTPTFALTVR